jgi:uncharacterized membrane protein
VAGRDRYNTPVRYVSAGFAIVATSWLVLLATAPHAALGVPVSGGVYAFSALICHQRVDRSFHIGASQMPVCARCYGLYLGAAIGACAWALSRGSLKMPLDRLRTTVAMAAIPTALTWTLEALGLWGSSNVTRFIAALPLGAAAALTVNYVGCAQPRRNDSRPPPTPI